MSARIQSQWLTPNGSVAAFAGFAIVCIWILCASVVFAPGDWLGTDRRVWFASIAAALSFLIVIAGFIERGFAGKAQRIQRVLSKSAEYTQKSVILVDAAGCIEWANPAFEGAFGAVADGRPRTLTEALGGDSGVWLNATALAIRRARAVVPDVRIDMRDGGAKWVEISIEPVFDAAEGATHFFVILNDMTDRKLALDHAVERREELEELVRERTQLIEAQSQELRAALERQKAVNEQQRSFVSMASHEFRTPLAIIDSAAQKLRSRAEKLQPHDIVARAETIRNAVKRMTDLMESVLSAAKFEDGRVHIDPKESDLRQIVADACRKYAELCPSHSISIDIEELPRRMCVDPRAIDQVVTNLLANAVKYSPAETAVIVRGRRAAGVVSIQVEDQGVGIDADDIPRMFSRFFRARTSSGIAGTGIGLSVVKLLVEKHGGSVTVASVKGEGSIFTIQLPQAAEQARAA